MNDEDLGKKITELLDTGLDGLSQKQVLRLRAARDNALARLAPSTVATAATPDGHTFNFGRRLLPMMVLLAGTILAAVWYALPNGETANDDSELLGDELPVHAYLDHDFDSWLNSSSR